jgi:putative addiction module component (TIGR02574 family)
MSFEEFKREALKLSFDEREELVLTLHKSLDEEEEDPEIERAIMTEVRRRYEAIKEGKTKLISAEEVFSELLGERD